MERLMNLPVTIVVLTPEKVVMMGRMRCHIYETYRV